MAFLTAADCGGCLAVTQQCQDCEAGCKADHIRQAQIESSVTEDSVGAASLKLVVVVVVMWPGGCVAWWSAKLVMVVVVWHAGQTILVRWLMVVWHGGGGGLAQQLIQ